jgi:uncharacterized lipoprotein YbaY
MRPRTPLALTLAAACLLLVAASCKSTPPPQLAGRVVTKAKVALPPNAVLEVQVADVTRTDAAPVVVARRTISPLGAPPWAFTLRADSLAALDPSHVYSLTARVLVDGKPRLVSKKRTLVNPARLADTLEVAVEPVPRTVGVRFGPPAAPGVAPGTDAADLWNPPVGPVTLPAPNPPLVASFAAGPVADRARGPQSPTEKPACPPSPVR